MFHISTLAVSGLKILVQGSTAEEILYTFAFVKPKIFLSSLFQNSIEHVNCVAPFQAFSKLAWKYYFKKHVNTRQTYYKTCTYIDTR